MNDTNENKGRMGWRWGRGWWILAPFICAGAVFLFGTAVMYLWNAVVPGVFTSLGPITFWQAIGILVLSKILFGGGWKGRGGWGRHGCGCGGWRGHRGGMYWKDKWMGMSEEEKAKFKEEWKNRCGDKC